MSGFEDQENQNSTPQQPVAPEPREPFEEPARPAGPYYGYDPSRYQGQSPQGEPYPYAPPPGGGKPGMSPGAKVFLVVFGALIVLVLAAFCLYGLLAGERTAAPASSQAPVTSRPQPPVSSQGVASGPAESIPKPVVNEKAPVLQLEPNEGFLTPLSAKEIAKKVKPSVVGVVTYTVEDGNISVIGQGSGIIMTADGYIITNSHVVGNSKGYRVRVVTHEEAEYDAVVIGFDSKTDLAAIKVEASRLVPAEFGDSDTLEVGDLVVAIGNPGGLTFAGSVTQGIVSALDRLVANVSSTIKLIQTDAAINPGNSGGPLVNEYGKVIGINSAKLVATSYEGMGFSIPIKQAKKVIDDLLKNGMVTNRVRIGVSCTSVQKLQASLYGLPQGLQIVEIPSDSALLGTRAQVNDIITHVDGVKVDDLAELYDALHLHAAGERVVLTLFRPKKAGESAEAQTLEVQVTLLADFSGSQ